MGSARDSLPACLPCPLSTSWETPMLTATKAYMSSFHHWKETEASQFKALGEAVFLEEPVGRR